MKKYSFLGLVLLGASAVTAAFLPANANTDEDQNAALGTLIVSAGGGFQTCISNGSGVNRCSYTVTVTKAGGISGTTGAGALGTLTAVVGNATASATTLVNDDI